MDNKLEKILYDNSSKFVSWVNAINNHQELRFSDKEYSEKEFSDLTSKTTKVFRDMSDQFIKYSSFKDKFDNSKMFLHIYGFSLVIKAEKTDTEFEFGIDDKGIYIELFLKNLENLRYMSDTFYQDILFLNSLGELEYVECEHYDTETKSKYQEFFNNKKSIIFGLIRNYLIGTCEKVSYLPAGSLKVMWKPDTDLYDIFSNGCLSFKTMYQLNYSLWKSKDIIEKNNNTCCKHGLAVRRLTVEGKRK